MKKLLIIAIISFNCIAAFAQTYNMSSSTTYHTCSGDFYDGGGLANDYPINQTVVVTFLPSTPGAKLSVGFTSFQTDQGKDFLYVYNGNDTSAPRIALLTGSSGYGTIASSAPDGSLTFKFISDDDNRGGNHEVGWKATISCSSTPPNDITMIASGSFTTCGGNFYDGGGPLGDYMINQNSVVTLYPSTLGAKLSVSLTSFQTDQGKDFLYVYNGNDTSAPRIALLTGSSGYGTIASSAPDGSLTFKFISDDDNRGGNHEVGWKATISCSSTPPNDITMIASGSFTTCGGNFYDGGGPLGDYMINQNSVVTLYPSTLGAKLSVSFTSFQTDQGKDFLYVYNGNDTSAPRIALLTGSSGYGTIASSAPDGSLTFKFISDDDNRGGNHEVGWKATISCSSTPPNDITMIASGSFTTCGGNFYDGGGPLGDYMINQNSVVTLYPSTLGAKLSVSFTSFQTDQGKDFLYVYNGNDTSAPRIALLTGSSGYGTIASSAPNGSLTFKFISDDDNRGGNHEVGWKATISCSSTPPNDITMIASGSFTTCGGNFYDGGGPLGDYMINQNSVVTLYPSTPGAKLSVSFTFFQTDPDKDFLYVYNGNDTFGTRIGLLTGQFGDSTISSSAADGSLTFKFTSKGFHRGGDSEVGWAATISCTGSGCTPPSTPTGFTATAISSSQIDISWNPVQDAIGYDIYYCDGTYIAFTSNTSYNHTGRIPSTTYSYKIAAQKSATCISPQTSCVNATTYNTPATSIISFYNNIANNLHFIFPKLMVSALINNIATPFKVCADGSQATFIEYQNNDPAVTTENIYFRIKEDINGSQTTVYGSFSGTTSQSSNIRKVYFNHPTHLDLTSTFRAANIEIIDVANGNSILATYPMEIYRAPIVFVHGFEGNSTTFENLRDNLILDNLYPRNLFKIRATDFNDSYASNGLTYTCSGNCIVNETVVYNPLLHLVDYRKTNGRSFSVNAKNNTVANGIDSVFKSARSNNYSCGKLILIGHSMGGVLSRLYLQSTHYRLDIQKLITINTPHYGTQFADWILAPLNTPLLKIIKFDGEYLSDKIGAISDFKVHSYANTGVLNIPISNQNKVPSHSISTSLVEPLAVIDNKPFAILIKSLFCDSNFLLGWYNCKNIFNSEPNDLIVPLSSQQGGFDWEESDYNRFHVGSTESEFVQAEVEVLIKSNPNGSNFSSSGFAKETLDYHYRNLRRNANQAARILDDSIKILNIVDGESFNLGDSINLSFANTNGISSIKVFITGGDNTIFVGSTAKVNSNIKFKIDSSEVGTRWIYLLGFDSLNFVDWDSVRINLNTSVELDSIRILPRNIILPLGYSEIISIKGYFHDGNIGDITNVAGLSLAFDTSKITIDDDYRVTGKKGPFKILLTANYLNKQDTVLIETTTNSSDNIADYLSDRNTICAGSLINYSDASLGIVQSRVWQFPGGSPSSSNSMNPTVTYNTPGTYPVTLIVSYSGQNDTVSRSDYTTVNPLPFPPTITASTATKFCQGGSVILASNAASGNQWYKDGVAISDSTRTTLNVTAGGSYTVKVTQNGCESVASNEIVVAVNPIPPRPIITKNSNQLTSSVTTGNQWYKDNVIIAGETGQNYTPTVSGSYTVQSTINNCASLLSNPFAYVYTSLPNIDVFGNDVKVFPNPVGDKLIILKANTGSILDIRIYDISGRLLGVFAGTLPKTEIDMSRFAAGLYIVKIEDRIRKISGKKVIAKLR